MTATAIAAPAPQANAITWFEIPVLDLNRATAFYETVLATKLTRAVYGEPMSIFPVQPNGLTGTLVSRPDLRPGVRGPMLYLDCTGRLDEAAALVEIAGGLLIEPITVIEGGFGRFATIRDTEGNRISLHSR